MSGWLRMTAMLGLWIGVATAALAQEQPLRGAATPIDSAGAVREEGPLGLVPFARGAYLHQIAADIDDGGRYSVNRAAVQAGPAYVAGEGRLIALAFGYRYDGYTFTGGGVFGQEPWSHVHTITAALVTQWEIDPRWTITAVPLASISGENGARFEKSITGGGIAGFTYCFRRVLKIGPGVGVTTQIETSPSVFPVLLVDWDITPKLNLSTGAGLGATQGPGLVLKWRPVETWELAVGGRYDRLRFRLDENGKIPNGIGEDSSFGVLASINYRFGPGKVAYAGLAAGLDFAGSLRIEDPNGTLIRSEGRNATVTVGFTLGVGF